KLPIDLNALAKRNQVRRSEQPHAQSPRAINAFQHRARRAFAVRARDMDEPKLFLRIARERREFEGVFQAQLGAEQPQAVKELNSFRISHGSARAAYGSKLFARQARVPAARGSTDFG